MSNISAHPSNTNWHQTATSSAALNHWLFDQGSLTQRLTQLCRTAFSVHLLTEGWQCLSADECQALNLDSGSSGWVREVLLCDGTRPWVFARSVADQAALQNADFDISQLGSRPLGHILFSDHAFSRGALFIRKIPSQDLPAHVQKHLDPQSQLWARRSSFSNKALTVMVAEVFLPQLWQDSHHTEFNSL